MSIRLSVAVALAVAAQHVGAADEPAQALHTAECVAALQVYTENLAVKIKAGQEDLKPLLLSRLEQGAAFIGKSYLDGNRDEAKSKALLDAATEAQKSLSPDALAARQTACSQEGAQLLAEASGLSRFVVSRLAKNRMKKLLKPDS